jgi:hypothetical protein
MKIFHFFFVFLLTDVAFSKPPTNVNSFHELNNFNNLIFWNILQYYKFTKVECSSSGKTSNQIFCNVKAISRNQTMLNFGCSLLRPIDNFYVRFSKTWKILIEKVLISDRPDYLSQEFDWKLSSDCWCQKNWNLQSRGQFRQVSNARWFDETLRRNLSWTDSQMSLRRSNFYFHIFKGLFIYLASIFQQTIKINNATLTLPKDKLQLWAFQPFPNGIYKTVVKVYDDEDEKIMLSTIYHELNFHFNVWDI